MASNLLSERNPQIAGFLLYSPRNEMTHTPVSTGTLPKIFLSHGRKDGVIPFSSGQALKKRLEGLGYGVTWVGFDGGHNITQDVLAQTGVFLTLIQEESGRLETR